MDYILLISRLDDPHHAEAFSLPSSTPVSSLDEVILQRACECALHGENPVGELAFWLVRPDGVVLRSGTVVSSAGGASSTAGESR